VATLQKSVNEVIVCGVRPSIADNRALGRLVTPASGYGFVVGSLGQGELLDVAFDCLCAGSRKKFEKAYEIIALFGR